MIDIEQCALSAFEENAFVGPNGIIDELGSNLDAIDRAAEMAGLSDYETVNVRDEYLASLTAAQFSSAMELYEAVEAQPDFELDSEQAKWPAFYQLYIPLE